MMRPLLVTRPVRPTVPQPRRVPLAERMAPTVRSTGPPVSPTWVIWPVGSALPMRKRPSPAPPISSEGVGASGPTGRWGRLGDLLGIGVGDDLRRRTGAEDGRAARLGSEGELRRDGRLLDDAVGCERLGLGGTVLGDVAVVRTGLYSTTARRRIGIVVIAIIARVAGVLGWVFGELGIFRLWIVWRGRFL